MLFLLLDQPVCCIRIHGHVHVAAQPAANQPGQCQEKLRMCQIDTLCPHESSAVSRHGVCLARAWLELGTRQHTSQNWFRQSYSRHHIGVNDVFSACHCWLQLQVPPPAQQQLQLLGLQP
jgi:hypothetical protein